MNMTDINLTESPGIQPTTGGRASVRVYAADTVITIPPERVAAGRRRRAGRRPGRHPRRRDDARR